MDLHPQAPPVPAAPAAAADSVLVAIDFETTGSVPGWPVEPWQVGLVELRCGVPTSQRFESLLRVGDRPFNPHAPGRHAVLRERLAAAPSLPDLWPDLSRWVVGRPLVAHNVGTERSLLRAAAPLHRLGPWVDTLRLVRRMYPRLASAALEDVVAALGLGDALDAACPGREPHDALFDAVACGLLLGHFLSLPGWGGVTVQALVDLA